MNTGAAPCGGQSQRAAAARSRAALTLVELLAVIAIIGLLVGLLLPAVQMAREAARRSSCASTLRQWGQAVQAYEHSYGVLPLGMSEHPCVNHGWIPLLWPYIEQEALASQFDFRRGDHDESAGIGAGPVQNFSLPTANPVRPMTRTLPIYYCPSDRPNTSFVIDPSKSAASAPRVNYRINTTIVTVGSRRLLGPFRRRSEPGFTGCGPSPSPGAPWVGFDPRGYAGAGHRRMGHIVDGLANTLMMSEGIVWPGEERDPRGMPYFFSFFDAQFTPNSAFDRVQSYITCIDAPPALPCQGTSSLGLFTLAARSRHSGGVQAVMCDGSVRFVSDLINQGTWQAQGTMNGREAPTLDE